MHVLGQSSGDAATHYPRAETSDTIDKLFITYYNRSSESSPAGSDVDRSLLRTMEPRTPVIGARQSGRGEAGSLKTGLRKCCESVGRVWCERRGAPVHVSAQKCCEEIKPEDGNLFWRNAFRPNFARR